MSPKFNHIINFTSISCLGLSPNYCSPCDWFLRLACAAWIYGVRDWPLPAWVLLRVVHHRNRHWLWEHWRRLDWFRGQFLHCKGVGWAECYYKDECNVFRKHIQDWKALFMLLQHPGTYYTHSCGLSRFSFPLAAVFISCVLQTFAPFLHISLASHTIHPCCYRNVTFSLNPLDIILYLTSLCSSCVQLPSTPKCFLLILPHQPSTSAPSLTLSKHYPGMPCDRESIAFIRPWCYQFIDGMCCAVLLSLCCQEASASVIPTASWLIACYASHEWE